MIMDKFVIFLLVIVLSSCSNKETTGSDWTHLKVDLQNYLYEGELLYHLENNTKQTLDSIKAKYSQNIIDSAELLHQETLKVVQFLDSFGDYMIDTNGGRDENGIPINQTKYISLERIFYANEKDAKLKSILTNHEQLLRSFGLIYPRIVYEPKDIITLKNDPLYREKNFIELHFEDRNIFEALSSIQYLKTSVILKEAAALSLLISWQG